MKTQIKTLLSYAIYLTIFGFAIYGNSFCKNLLNFLTVTTSVFTSFMAIVFGIVYTRLTTAELYDDKLKDVYQTIQKDKHHAIRATISMLLAGVMFGMGWYVIGTLSFISNIMLYTMRDLVKSIAKEHENSAKSE